MGCGSWCKHHAETEDYRGYPEPCGYCHKFQTYLYDFDEDNNYEANETIPVENCKEYREYLSRHKEHIQQAADAGEER